MNSEQLQQAMGDISVIRQTLDKSRMQMKRLSSLFFLYGGIQLALMGGYLLWFLFEPGPSGSDPASLEAYRKLGRAINLGLLWAYHLMYLIIGGFWLVWRRGLQ